MDGLPAEPIGTRIRYWRRRRGGMTQAVLAGLAGVSQSYVSHVEAGRKGIERRSTLVAIANALQVSVADLLGQPGDPTDPAKATAAAAVPAIRVALLEIEDGQRRRPTMTADQLAAGMSQLHALRARADYASMAPLLADLLVNGAAAGGRQLLAQIGYDTGDVLKNLGYQDLALTAARIALHQALEAEDPGWTGATRYFYIAALPTDAADLKSRVAARSISEMQAHASDERARQMLGQLHLSASLAAAVQQQPDDAGAHLREAEREATTLGDPEDGVGFNLAAFGPTNVGLWRMTVALEQGEYGRVVELARTLQPGQLKIADRHFSYWLNYGAALAHSGKHDPEAVVAFMRAERTAPVPFSENELARGSVITMLHRSRRRAAPPKDLEMIARRLGINTAA
jgi:transcriptional regulator with XRE-family HTH domain